MQKPASLLAPSRSEVLQHELTAERPAFRLDMNAFTEEEKLVFAVLARKNTPQSLYSIYSALAGEMAGEILLSKLTEDERKENNLLAMTPKQLKEKRANEKKEKKKISPELEAMAKQVAEGFVAFTIVGSFLNLKSKDLIRSVQEVNKTYGTHIPTYKTVRRICEDFSDAKLIGKRVIGKKTMYFLPSDISEKYAAQLKNLNV